VQCLDEKRHESNTESKELAHNGSALDIAAGIVIGGSFATSVVI
jgi:large-conductance mechanosensitive channel